MKPVILMMLLSSCCSCCSSSSVAAFFFFLIPRTGPHFRKVTGIEDLVAQVPFMNEFYKRASGKKTDKENKLQVENIRKSNPDGVAKFCATVNKIRANRKTPPYDQPGEILTIGGMKKGGDIMKEAMEPLGASVNYVEIAAREFCGM